MKRILVIAVWLVFYASSAHALLVSDGSFSNWSFDQVGIDGGTANVFQEVAGGNPGARLNMTTHTGNFGSAYGTAIYNNFSMAGSALSGANFTLSLDVLSGPGAFGQGQAISLLVNQNGTIYAQYLGITDVHNAFTTLNFNGVFTEASFTRLIGAGPANPTFNGTLTTFFGFAGINSISGDLTNFYDNFSLDIPTFGTSAVPEPGSLLLLVVGAVALAALKRRL